TRTQRARLSPPPVPRFPSRRPRRPPPRLVPYTTLFRSWPPGGRRAVRRPDQHCREGEFFPMASTPLWDRQNRQCPDGTAGHPERSEEHTSELQSRQNLVCRLLLEQKKPAAGSAPSLVAT